MNLQKISSLGGLEPPTFRLTAERANRLRHRDVTQRLERALFVFKMTIHGVFSNFPFRHRLDSLESVVHIYVTHHASDTNI